METIKSNIEISEIFSKGKRSSNRFVTFIIHSLPEEADSDDFQHDPRGRVAFIAGKRHGNAVWRNAAKRRLREVCRALCKTYPDMLNQADLLMVAKPNIMDADFKDVEHCCKKSIGRICDPSQGNVR